MRAAILLPAPFAVIRAERLFFAVADRADAIRRNARLHQCRLRCVRAIVAQRQVVFRRSTLVAVSLNRELDVRVRLQEIRVSLDRRLVARTEIVLVVVEENVLHVLRERLSVRFCRRWWWRRRWLRHRYSRRGILRSAGSLRGQAIGHRIRRRNLRRTVRIDLARAFDRDVRRIRSLPGQCGRLALLNRRRVRGQRSRRSRRRWRWWRWRRLHFLFAGAQY